MSFSTPTLGLSRAMTGLVTILLRFAIILLILIIGAAMWILWPLMIGAGWIPTPKNVVKKMLYFAGVGPSDTLIDLGSGDGRIIFMATLEYEAIAVGIEAARAHLRKRLGNWHLLYCVRARETYQ